MPEISLAFGIAWFSCALIVNKLYFGRHLFFLTQFNSSFCCRGHITSRHQSRNRLEAASELLIKKIIDCRMDLVRDPSSYYIASCAAFKSRLPSSIGTRKRMPCSKFYFFSVARCAQLVQDRNERITAHNLMLMMQQLVRHAYADWIGTSSRLDQTQGAQEKDLLGLGMRPERHASIDGASADKQREHTELYNDDYGIGAVGSSTDPQFLLRHRRPTLLSPL